MLAYVCLCQQQRFVHVKLTFRDAIPSENTLNTFMGRVRVCVRVGGLMGVGLC